MKKVIIHTLSVFVLCIIMLLYLSACNDNSLGFDKSADSTKDVFDPLDITGDKLELLERDDLYKCSVIKLHFGSYLKGFSENKSIEELLSDEYTVHEKIGVRRNGNAGLGSHYSIYYYTYEDGEMQFFEYEDYHDAFNKYLDCINSYEKIFNSTLATSHLKQLQVTQMYILDGDISGFNNDTIAFREGFFVYYVTNHGDYVYYVPNPNEVENDYLMPVEEFYDCAKTVYSDLQKLGEKQKYYGMHTDIEELYDLSKYKVGSAYTRLAIIISSVAVVAVIIIALMVVVRRKKKKGDCLNRIATKKSIQMLVCLLALTERAVMKIL